MNPDLDPVLTGSESGSGLFSEVGSGSGPNRSGSATLVAETLWEIPKQKWKPYGCIYLQVCSHRKQGNPLGLVLPPPHVYIFEPFSVYLPKARRFD